MQKYIKLLVEGKDLSYDQAKAAMESIMNGEATQAQIGSFLTAMRMKGETIEEITACAKVMREKSGRVTSKEDLLDIVGTGGDGANTFNVSTIASLVVAAAGVKVAKHGNRSVSSQCGSADVLEALGVKIDLLPHQNTKLLEEIGICFMFAPVYHSSMKYAAEPRKQLAIRSIFNILGPLSSPACANLQVLGVYQEDLVWPMANVLNNLGIKHAMVVCGHDGLDEVSLTAPTTVCEVNEGRMNSFFIEPKTFGFERCKIEDLRGGEISENAQIARDILGGQKGHKRNMVVLNAAMALYTAFNQVTLRECVGMAEEVIDSGKAKRKLEDFVEMSRSR